jgi:hypothetical protein
METVASKSSHADAVVFAWLRQTGNSNVTVPDRFNLEDSHTLGNAIESGIKRLEEGKYLGWFAHTGPRRKTDNISKHWQ